MRLRIHTCKALGCQHVITTRMLMCITHWGLVPAAMKRRVLQARRGLRLEPQSIDALNEWASAAAEAIQAVAEKQERKARGGLSAGLFNGM